MKKLVGKVTKDESLEIQALFERRNGLSELAKIIDANNNDLYERLVADISETSAKFQFWWDTTSQKYEWENHPGGSWEIDFGTGDIYLNY